jgi:hypothetical protein
MENLWVADEDRDDTVLRTTEQVTVTFIVYSVVIIIIRYCEVVVSNMTYIPRKLPPSRYDCSRGIRYTAKI